VCVSFPVRFHRAHDLKVIDLVAEGIEPVLQVGIIRLLRELRGVGRGLATWEEGTSFHENAMSVTRADTSERGDCFAPMRASAVGEEHAEAAADALKVEAVYIVQITLERSEGVVSVAMPGSRSGGHARVDRVELCHELALGSGRHRVRLTRMAFSCEGSEA
jgi:hypothetical protein